MKTFLYLLIGTALLSLGCAVLPDVAPSTPYPVYIATQNAYDLEVEVWDRATNGGLPGVRVKLSPNGVTRVTDVKGLVKLPTPYGARDVTIYLTYIAHDGLQYTEERGIHLEHGFTRARVDIETRRWR